MIYNAKEPKTLLIILFIITLIYANAFDSALSYVFYLLLFLFFIGMILNYRFVVEEDQLLYEIRIFSKVIFKRTIEAFEINKVQIVHLGSRTIVLIHVKNRMKLKLQRFSPVGLESEINQFANKHAIIVENNRVKEAIK